MNKQSFLTCVCFFLYYFYLIYLSIILLGNVEHFLFIFQSTVWHFTTDFPNGVCVCLQVGIPIDRPYFVHNVMKCLRGWGGVIAIAFDTNVTNQPVLSNLFISKNLPNNHPHPPGRYLKPHNTENIHIVDRTLSIPSPLNIRHSKHLIKENTVIESIIWRVQKTCSIVRPLWKSSYLTDCMSKGYDHPLFRLSILPFQPRIQLSNLFRWNFNVKLLVYQLHKGRGLHEHFLQRNQY